MTATRGGAKRSFHTFDEERNMAPEDLEDEDVADEAIGDLAEDKVRVWAGLSAITAHRPERDKRGWDFLFEYDLKPDSNETLDQTESSISCKIQVKATHTDSGRINIKLSNWDYMIKALFPFFVFIVVIRKSDPDNPMAVYLVHVGEEYIAQALRRLRELKPEEKGNLHKKTLQIKWGEKDKLEPPYGESLGKKIREHVGLSAIKYIQRKIDWLKRVGYGEKPIAGQISFHCPDRDPDKLYTQLANLAIGYLDKLPIDDIEMDEVRFGIPKPIELLSAAQKENLESISISIDPLPSLGQVKVTIGDLRQEALASFMCEMYRASAVFPFLPPSKDKWRYASTFIDLTMEVPPENSTQGHIRINVKIPEEVSISTGDLIKAARALKILYDEQRNGINLSFEFYEKGRETASGKVIHTSIPLPAYDLEFPARTNKLFLLAEQVSHLCRLFEVEDSVKVTLQALMEPKNQFPYLLFLLQPTPENLRGLELNFENKNGEAAIGKRTAAVTVASSLIGNHLIIVIAAIIGTSVVPADKTTDGKEWLCVEDKSIRIMRKQHMIVHDDGEVSILPLLDQCVDELVKEGFYIVLNVATGRLFIRQDT